MKTIIHVLLGTFVFLNTLIGSEEKVLEASNSLQLIIRNSGQSIPPMLIKKAQAIAVFPSVTKIGFLFGGLFGEGVMSKRTQDGWSDPINLKIKGGSVGLQFGFESSDIVLFILKPSIVEDMLDTKITLGVDASVSAGPIGGSYEEMTDFKLSQDIYAYANNSGLFVGASLGGTVMSVNDKDTTVPSSYASRTFIETIKRLDK